MMIYRQSCTLCLLIVWVGNINDYFCHRHRNANCTTYSCFQNKFTLIVMALRNQETDEHLQMTPINQQDKSSVPCVTMRDRQSPCMQTMSPICQRHKRSSGRPHLHHFVHNNVFDHSIDYFIVWKRMSLRCIWAVYLLWPLQKIF